MFDTIRSLLRTPRTARPAPKRRPIRCRPVVEGLEDRTVPSATAMPHVIVLPFQPAGGHGAAVHHHHAHHHGHHRHGTSPLARIEADLAARQGPGVTLAGSQGSSSGGSAGSSPAAASDNGNTPVTITGQPNPNVTHGTNHAVLTQRPTTNNQGQGTSTGTGTGSRA